MFSLNRATIIGNATRDAEMRYTPNGQAVTSFGVATNRRWTNRDSGETQEQVEFHDITAWGKMAENITPMVKKGTPVYVEGRLQTRSWEGQDGAKRQKTEIIAENIIVLGFKGGQSGAGDYQSQPAKSENPVEEISKNDAGETKTEKPSTDTEEIDIDEIPF